MNCCETDVPTLLPEQVCDICGSKENIESRQLEVTSCGGTEMEKIGYYRQSNLCKICKEQGWSLLNDTADFGRISYFNSKNPEFKRV